MAEKEVNLSEYLSLFWRYKYLILITTILFSSMGVVLFKYEVPVYTSKANLVLGSETLGTGFEIGSVLKLSSIVPMAKSYSTMATVVERLELEKKPIQKGLLESMFLTQNTTEYLEFRELIFYYLNNINVKASGRDIVVISATSQDPKITAAIANEIGKIIIEENLKIKNEKVQKSVAYIDSQIKSLTDIINSVRLQKEETEASSTYSETMNLMERIDRNEIALNSYRQERDRVQIVLDLSKFSSPDTEAEEIAKDRLVEENEDKLAYVNSRIAAVESELEEDKKKWRDLDKADYYKAQDLEFAIATNENLYLNLLSERQRIGLAATIESRDINFLSRAYVPLYTDKTRGIVFIIIFFGIGLGASFGLIQVKELLNKRFKSSTDVEQSMDLKVIGNLPIIKKEEEYKLANPKGHPKSNIVESYRTLATNIKFATKGKNIKSIVFTSDKPGTGKSMTLANLGMVMADSGAKILVVDVDLRRPNMHKIFNKPRKPGLTELLSGKATLSQVLVKIRPHLYMIPAGSISLNPQSVIESKQMKKLIDKLAGHYDFVLYDSIPLTSFSDVALLASITDASVLVMDEKKSERSTMKLSKERLEDVNSNILGITINRSRKGFSKYHYKYYRYYSSEPDSAPKKKDFFDKLTSPFKKKKEVKKPEAPHKKKR